MRRLAFVLAFAVRGLVCPLAQAQSADTAIFAKFDAAAQREVAAGHIPGAVILFGQGDNVGYRRAFGSTDLDQQPAALAPDAIFDLASLTKVIATTTAVMQLVELGRIELDAPVSQYWPEFGQNGKTAITVRQLLTHTSGLPPDLDLARDWSGKEEALRRVAESKPAKPAGQTFLYGDINFIVLGELVERASGEPLQAYVRGHIFAPLGMADTSFLPSTDRLPRIAATDREDGSVRKGQVQDPTAYRMGGVAGHAGLFSTADDLARFSRMMLGGGSLGDAHILNPLTIGMMTQAVPLPGGVRRTLGWDAASPYSVGMDQAFGEGSYGHTGYTGCLLWIDPRTKRYLIVLTSRLHPFGRGDAKPLRLALARIIQDLNSEGSPGPVGATGPEDHH